ncbi:MAG TPA: indole-3-glycerol phosphate synthase TrpC, partial [Longimicrobiaceae bacterium]|nr:indole-3-glycerol phosphate synthase TrpC [Longimicrobiaceae bacterium]
EVKREEVKRLLPRGTALRSEAAAAASPRRFAAALREPAEVRLLAEVKRKSPSAGPIRPGAEPEEVARAYEAGGAAALSVLTDETFFDGSLAALRGVRAAVGLPVLRKDFVIDAVQVWEARAAGADAILLIVRILDDSQLSDLHTLARELGMDVLVEVHDERELQRAGAMGATLIGINTRDLRTFHTDLHVATDLAPTIDPKITLVAESGIRTPEDVQRLGATGVDAILVGESLMRQRDIRAAAAALTGHPRNPLVRRS